MENQSLSKRIFASKELKNLLISEHFENGTSISELARRNHMHPITLYAWKRKMSEQNQNPLDLKKLLEEIENLKKENKQLQKSLGKATLKNECLEDIVEYLKKREREDQLKKQLASLNKDKKENTQKK